MQMVAGGGTWPVMLLAVGLAGAALAGCGSLPRTLDADPTEVGASAAGSDGPVIAGLPRPSSAAATVPAAPVRDLPAWPAAQLQTSAAASDELPGGAPQIHTRAGIGVGLNGAPDALQLSTPIARPRPQQLTPLGTRAPVAVHLPLPAIDGGKLAGAGAGADSWPDAGRWRRLADPELARSRLERSDPDRAAAARRIELAADSATDSRWRAVTDGVAAVLGGGRDARGSGVTRRLPQRPLAADLRLPQQLPLPLPLPVAPALTAPSANPLASADSVDPWSPFDLLAAPQRAPATGGALDGERESDPAPPAPPAAQRAALPPPPPVVPLPAARQAPQLAVAAAVPDAPATAAPAASAPRPSQPAAARRPDASPAADSAGGAAAPAPTGEAFARVGEPIEMAFAGEGWIYLGNDAGDNAQPAVELVDRSVNDGRTLFSFLGRHLGRTVLEFVLQNPVNGAQRREAIALDVVGEAEFQRRIGALTPELRTESPLGREIADALYADGLLDVALEQYLRNYRPGDPELNQRIAELYARDGQFAAAEKYWRFNLELQPTAADSALAASSVATPPAGQPTAHARAARIGLVRAAAEQQDLGALQQHLHEFLTLRGPDTEQPLAAVARLLHQSGQPRTALQVTAAFLRRFPSSDWLAEVLYRRAALLEQDAPYRDLEQARAHYRRVVREFPASEFAAPARQRVRYLDRNFFRVR